MTVAATAPPEGGRFLMVPVDLLQTFAGRPLVPGLYLGLARLSEYAQQSVPASRGDLAAWCAPDATRNTGLATAIKRAIDDLRPLGWLAVETGAGRKLWLAPAWGLGRDGRARAWRWSRPDRGRPARLRFVRVPLELIDRYLGTLYPDPEAPARVECLFDRPLLELADIGTYAQRLANIRVPLTRLTRLQHLGLVDERGIPQPLHRPDEVLQQVAAGQLTLLVDGQPAAVGLAAEGRRLHQLQQRNQVTDTGTFDVAQHGSEHGSEHGSREILSDAAPERPNGVQDTARDAAWERSERSREEMKTPPTLIVEMRAHERLEEEKDQLDSLIRAGHRALNQGRTIPNVEWWGLLTFQQEHGRTAVLAWQRRAAGAGRTVVRLAYYERCAAAAACAQVRPVRSSAAAHAEGGPLAEDTRMRQVRPSLTAEQQAALRELEHAAGEPVRAPWRIAATPEQIRAWAQCIADPGLRAFCHLPVLHYAVDQLAQGLPPPSTAQLAHWAARAATASPRERWNEDKTRQLAGAYGDLFRLGSDTADLPEAARDATSVLSAPDWPTATASIPGSPSERKEIAAGCAQATTTAAVPDDVHGSSGDGARETLPPLADMARAFTQARQVRVLLRERSDPTYHRSIERLQLVVQEEATEVRCVTERDQAIIGGVLLGMLCDVLAELGLPAPKVVVIQRTTLPARPPDLRRSRWAD